MDSDGLYLRFRELQAYVGWTSDDAKRVLEVKPVLAPLLPQIVEDFYAELQRHPEAVSVITGGQDQVERLKRTLLGWLGELLSAKYDEDYVLRRWLVGRRHVEIGLDQVYTNAAMSRLRLGLIEALEGHQQGPELLLTQRALIRLTDLDLAIIEDAYQAEYVQRVQAAERLAQSAEKQRLTRAREQSDTVFRLLVETAECLVVILRESGETVFLNPFAAEICEGTAGTLVEQWGGQLSFEGLIAEASHSPAENASPEAVTRLVSEGLELPVRCSDGRERWVLWHARRLGDYEGSPAILAVGLDITERRKAQDRVLQSERLAAIGQMVTGLAHESRNALQRSQANLEMLMLEVEDRPEAIRLVQRTQKAQEHLHHLYEEVRSYAAPITLRREICDLLEVAQVTWVHLEMFRKGRPVRLITETATADVTCSADRHALEQVFRNVFENSIVACPEEGEIRVILDDSKLEGLPAVRVTVRDNGPGLSAEQAARIFEPFFTTKTEGTGLGMAITKRIVEAHAGQIAVGSSQPGTEVVILLPRQ